MATKKKAAPKKRIDLHEEIRRAMLRACAGAGSTATLSGLQMIGRVALGLYRYDGSKPINTAIEQEVRDLIASGQIVKVKGVYRVGHIGGPGGAELPRVQSDEADVFSRKAK